MPDKSSLYRQWLGIEEASPNYYQLLGVARGEADIVKLQQAAQAALAKLKQLSVADGDDQRREMAREIKQAYAVLSDPKARADYEVVLSRAVSPPPKSKQAVPIPVAVEVVGEPLTTESREAKITIHVPKQRSARGVGGPLIWLMLVGIFVIGPAILISLIWFASPRTSNRLDQAANDGSLNADTMDQEAVSPDTAGGAASGGNANPLTATAINRAWVTTAARDAARAIDSGSRETEAIITARLAVDRAAIVGQLAADAPVVETTPTVAERFRLLQVRWRLAERNYDQAAAILGDELAGAATSEQQQLWADWQQLVKERRAFWDEFEVHAQQIKAAREFELNGEPCSVIGIEAGGLLFKAQGTSLLARWEDLPPETVFFLLESVGIRDIPSWRKLKAGWLLSRGPMSEATRDSVTEWLDLAEADGHDVQHLKRILQRSLAENPDALTTGAIAEEASAALVEVLQATRATPLRASRSELEQSLAIAAKSLEAQDRLDHLIRCLRLAIAEDHWIRCREVTDLIALEHPIDTAVVLLECSRQIVDRDQIAGQAAANLVDDLIELSGRGWNSNSPRADADAFLDLAGQLSVQRNLRLQSNRLSRLR